MSKAYVEVIALASDCPAVPTSFTSPFCRCLRRGPPTFRWMWMTPTSALPWSLVKPTSPLPSPQLALTYAARAVVETLVPHSPMTMPGSFSPPDPPAPRKAWPCPTAAPPRLWMRKPRCSAKTHPSAPTIVSLQGFPLPLMPPARKCGWLGVMVLAWFPPRVRWCAPAWISARG